MTTDKEFVVVTLNLTKGSAYEYRKSSSVPTIIKFKRLHDGRYERGIIKGDFSNTKLHDIVYLIKRGYEMSDIDIQVKANY